MVVIHNQWRPVWVEHCTLYVICRDVNVKLYIRNKHPEVHTVVTSHSSQIILIEVKYHSMLFVL